MSEGVSTPSDGVLLSGTLYRPEGEVVTALVIHAAVGVPQHLYSAFCEWAAGQGRLCLTYDYREIGASATGPLRASDAGFVDWGLKDQAAALAFVQAQAPSAPLHVIGHSLGGFMTPFHGQASDIAAMTTVASGQAFKDDHPMPFRLSAYLYLVCAWPAADPHSWVYAKRLAGRRWYPGQRLFGSGGAGVRSLNSKRSILAEHCLKWLSRDQARR